MNSLKIGEKVIYPNQGLGVVEDIQVRSFNGESLKIFSLRILSNNTLVLIPSAEFLLLGVRRPLEETAIKRVYSYMRSGDIDLRMNWKGRYKEHINLMRTGGLQDLALVLKSLFCLSRIKPLSFREKKMMEKAKELIVSEISEATAMSAKQVEHKILESLSRFCRDSQDRASL